MLDIINALLKAKTQKKKIKLLQDQHEKNIQFFARKHPEVGEFIKNSGTSHFRIAVNDEFLDIIDLSTGALCHPKGKLLQTIQDLGAWHHDRWIDKLEVTHRVLNGVEHGDITLLFISEMHKAFPLVTNNVMTGIIKLPKLKDGKRFSGAVAFVGIFAGLHIIHYLNTTQVRDLIFIEPNLDNFVLSSWFLDYEAIEKNWRLILHIGPDLPDSQLTHLLDESPVTATAWLRVLPVYAAPEYQEVVHRLHLRWRTLTEVIVPFDRERRNLLYGLKNLKNNYPINHIPPKLSGNSRIAIVASGPSLTKDLPWLKHNQDKLIILAAHSTIKILKQNGIRPDFLCSLDTEIDDELMAKLDFDYDIPFISYYKAESRVLSHFKTVLLVNEGNKANSVYFYNPITGTHPTTGNLATAVAVFAKPKQLYFIGLDLAFRSTSQEHALGYWLGDSDVVGEDIQSGVAQANFVESQGAIYTQSYYDTARLSIEHIIRQLTETEIYNLSDGAKINGAQPVHSESLVLADYPEKLDDLDRFLAGFSTRYAEIWKPYPTKGKAIIEIVSEAFKETLLLQDTKQFNWLEFSKKLDNTWRVIVQKFVVRNPSEIDLRIELFNKLIHDLLTDWYRIMLFTTGNQELQQAYIQGLEIISTILQNLQWEDELDSLCLHGETSNAV